jgi:hypothetical protein
MNNVEQPPRPSVPLLKGSEEQVIKLRKRLEDVFRNVSLAHDVVALCVELSQGSGDFNPEIAHVLRRCAAEKLYFQMKVLTTARAPWPAATRRAHDIRLVPERSGRKGGRTMSSFKLTAVDCPCDPPYKPPVDAALAALEEIT